MNGSIVLGIDVAKAKLDCALRLPDGKFKNKVFENNPKGFKTLTEWVEKHGATAAHVCMEATGVYWEAVAEYLANEEMTVSVAKLIIGAMMRKLIHVAFGVLKSGKNFDPALHGC